MKYNIEHFTGLRLNEEVKNKSSKCLHGIETISCGYCSGMISQREAVKREPRELEEKYERAKATFKNFGEDWSEEEIIVVYDHFKDIHKRLFKKEVYKVAFELERTTNAIRWMIKHLFSKRTDLHRGQIVIAFRESVGLKEGVDG